MVKEDQEQWQGVGNLIQVKQESSNKGERRVG